MIDERIKKMTKQEFLNNILTIARTPGNDAHKPWAQYPTTRQRAQAILSARLATEEKYGEDTTCTRWALAKLR